MSNTQFAFLKKENVPTQAQWQKAIDELNFQVRLTIDPELAPFEDEGFSPCQWGDTDEDVGFEICYEPAEDVFDDDDEFKSVAAGNDYCISMSWGGELKDCAAVMIASCALATSFDAVISYEGDEPDSLEKLVSNTKDVILEAEKE
ncbi:hypothetical protein ISG33_11180 [Glaciecola sp. MH2013]|uniref:hypothetical protein n=1 Tax=Glaciecola sp. MH2013 TaxID=2785524 RepID=UPI00189C69E1|nr:hypothetical protein [Glaciecola sp. MH2013]MBF7073962.1 hypothetical protein [Glaciecola sp. MH2013]